MLNTDPTEMKPGHLDMKEREEHLAYMERDGFEFLVVAYNLKAFREPNHSSEGWKLSVKRVSRFGSDIQQRFFTLRIFTLKKYSGNKIFKN